MARARFLRDFDWKPPEKPSVTITIKAGTSRLVRRACFNAAIAAGAAEPMNAGADHGSGSTPRTHRV